MDAGTAAILGAAIGALGGLGGGWLTVFGQGRHQRRQQAAERERWRNELRRDAYNTCIASMKRLSASWWKFSDQMWSENSTPEQWQSAFVEAHDAWTQFSAAVAAVAVAGPHRVVDAADQLRSAMYDLEKCGLHWYRAAQSQGHGRLDENSFRFRQAMNAKKAPDRAFQKAAREALGTEQP
ncbi:hypothetical protein GCM10010329_68270 [Streptomyces spiroverticillatus]|uniref:Uncharacterized protein n=1 Tax=Streptomyces finlayi TaxID=67296 RepID=A0A919CDV6_9ACTN|nr:hypothetical protein [Streptomyces finlayi]GHA35435.1 hypothetical protein GCM10010329_68270 [Streptomyces spiroverticillatus]GHD12854.1 hypothetical protein GCM10010334_70410 [Streptomyces finlayi]